jgi:hypothetical protein
MGRTSPVNTKTNGITRASTSGTKFGSVFSSNGYGKPLAGYTLTQIVNSTVPNDPYRLGAHCVAALLNARKGLTPILSEAQVKNIFSEFDSKGYFEPTSGVKWYPADIVAYLKTTMK